jgi:hypothetical protein
MFSPGNIDVRGVVPGGLSAANPVPELLSSLPEIFIPRPIHVWPFGPMIFPPEIENVAGAPLLAH